MEGGGEDELGDRLETCTKGRALALTSSMICTTLGQASVQGNIATVDEGPEAWAGKLLRDIRANDQDLSLELKISESITDRKVLVTHRRPFPCV